MSKINYIYILDYCTPSICEIRVEGDINIKDAEGFIRMSGFNLNTINYMITDKKLELDEQPGVYVNTKGNDNNESNTTK